MTISRDFETDGYIYRILLPPEDPLLKEIYDKTLHQMNTRFNFEFNYFLKDYSLEILVSDFRNFIIRLLIRNGLVRTGGYLRKKALNLTLRIIFVWLDIDAILVPFLDDSIREIILGSKDSSISVRHRGVGWCGTDIFLSEPHMRGLIARARKEYVSERSIDDLKYLEAEFILQPPTRIRVMIYYDDNPPRRFSMRILKEN